jgi:hypothetical protein
MVRTRILFFFFGVILDGKFQDSLETCLFLYGNVSEAEVELILESLGSQLL